MPEKIANSSWVAESRRTPVLDTIWDRLKPFPGRGRLALRIAILCTFVVLVADTFRMPFQDLLPFFILFITKEEKVTTTVTVLLVLLAVTISIGAAILLYKCTGNRAEFRIPAIALEIFIGMYLFRVLSLGPVGWILGFVCAATQSLVYLFPNSEETVHQFLWLWLAVALSAVLCWFANYYIFPVSPVQLLQREFVSGWRAVFLATEQLTKSPSSAGTELLRAFVKAGPVQSLKLLKLSLIGSRDLQQKKLQLSRMILGLDKITRLLFSYAGDRIKSAGFIAESSGDTAILAGLKEKAERLRQNFESGLLPDWTAIQATTETERGVSPRLLEAENTLKDLAAQRAEKEERPQKAGESRHKPSLFVPDAFTNPRHAQFAIKVALAGMIGYLFYTASDYYGIHTVFYTPLIIALFSSGATIHKAFLRIVGCTIGGVLGLISLVWVIPKFETLGTFLFLVFWVHALAGWIAVGSEEISYVGLQIALAFDLGFLQGYGPVQEIDPLRDRFIGIVIGICIVSTVFALIWPESAALLGRERLAACMRAIARLLRLGGASNGSQESSAAREQLELEIASRLAEANSYSKQAGFEELLYGSTGSERSKLNAAIAATERIFVSTLPWLREQISGRAERDGGPPATTPEFAGRLADAMETCADWISPLHINPPPRQIASPNETPIDELIENSDVARGEKAASIEGLASAIAELQVLVSPLPRPR
ncbi:MAG: FUSC family protein [Verrucomicrobia bacterium]|nr:FUSC family protein [Verrucomicrobiota bacterium]